MARLCHHRHNKDKVGVKDGRRLEVCTRSICEDRLGDGGDGWWWLDRTSEAAGRARQLQCGGEASLHPPVSPTPRTGHHPHPPLVISTLHSHFQFFHKWIDISSVLLIYLYLPTHPLEVTVYLD